MSTDLLEVSSRLTESLVHPLALAVTAGFEVANSMVDPTACSNLSAATPVKPPVDFGAGTIGTPMSRIVRLTNQGAAALIGDGA